MKESTRAAGKFQGRHTLKDFRFERSLPRPWADDGSPLLRIGATWVSIIATAGDGLVMFIIILHSLARFQSSQPSGTDSGPRARDPRAERPVFRWRGFPPSTVRGGGVLPDVPVHP